MCLTDMVDSFIKVAALANITPEVPYRVEVNGLQIGLYNVDGAIYAIDDICSHEHAHLSEGEQIENIITCPRHGAEFDVCTGKALTLPATQPVSTYEVRVEGEDVFVR